MCVMYFYTFFTHFCIEIRACYVVSHIIYEFLYCDTCMLYIFTYIHICYILTCIDTCDILIYINACYVRTCMLRNYIHSLLNFALRYMYFIYNYIILYIIYIYNKLQYEKIHIITHFKTETCNNV